MMFSKILLYFLNETMIMFLAIIVESNYPIF